MHDAEEHTESIESHLSFMTTTIANDYLQLVTTISEQMDIPRIKSIHFAQLGADPKKSSKFGAMLLSDGTTGMTYTGLDNALLDLQEPNRTKDIPGQSPLQIAQLYSGEFGWQRSLGMAAINAISQFVLKQSRCRLPSMTKTISELALECGDRVGMVGYFPPLVEQVRSEGASLTVVELDEYWLSESNGVLVTLDPEHLRECNKVVCTGTMLVNQTLDSVLQYCQNATKILMVGPTVGCLPEPLFDRGLTMLGSNRVVDPRLFLELWSTRQRWRDATERYSLSMEAGYPGIDTLLSRANSRREQS